MCNLQQLLNTDPIGVVVKKSIAINFSTSNKIKRNKKENTLK